MPELPDSFLFSNRHGDGRCPVCGRPLRRTKLAGRTAYLCPLEQPAP